MQTYAEWTRKLKNMNQEIKINKPSLYLLLFFKGISIWSAGLTLLSLIISLFFAISATDAPTYSPLGKLEAIFSAIFPVALLFCVLMSSVYLILRKILRKHLNPIGHVFLGRTFKLIVINCFVILVILLVVWILVENQKCDGICVVEI